MRARTIFRQSGHRHWGLVALRQSLPAALAVWLLWILRDRLAVLDPEAVLANLAEVGPGAWCAAALATFISFRAVGRYDALVQAQMDLPTPARAAHRTGMAAIAVAQLVGFGLVSGTAARWRLLPDLGLGGAARVTVRVAVSFLMAWAVLTLAALAFLPLAPGLDPALASAARVALAVVACLAWRLRRRLMPMFPFGVRLLGLAAVDTAAAGTALWFLFPVGTGLDLATFLPVYLLSLGAALVAGLPGGLGVFETVMLTAFPGAAPDGVMAGVLAFRVLYYAVPALLAGAAMVRGPLAVAPRRTARRAEVERFVAKAPRAEAGLARQAGHVVLTGPSGSRWLAARAGSTLVALLDPDASRHALPAALTRLRRQSRVRGLGSCLYKIGPRTAAVARRAGYSVLPVAEELWLDPRRWDLSSPTRAGLRRKLRKARRGGVELASCPPGALLPMAEMAGVSQAWSLAHGGERGLSMGRFAPDYVRGQHVLLAHVGGTLVAFLSLHQGAREWTVDLMRQTASAPEGTMHALVVRAIEDATTAGLPRLSLAAAALPDRGRGVVERLYGCASNLGRTNGLRQFKDSFAPNRAPLYIAARSPLALAVAAFDLICAIRYPVPLPSRGIIDRIHDLRDEYEIESDCPTWHIGPDALALRGAATTKGHEYERPAFPPA